MPLDRPIPAFYCCYLLRSTVRHSSVYVGSTPNPVRRLRQHNGLAKGGAARTSRHTLRPWEMACIVTGFPSHIAALQFEWAWQNPHITLHIPPESRIQHATQKKRSGQPKRPRHSVTSLLSNLHLLLRVPSFSRWPLEVRFFSEDVYRAWVKWCKTVSEPMRESINVVQDFEGKSVPAENGTELASSSSRGIEALVVDYANEKSHVEKAKEIVDFEMEGNCTLCSNHMDHDAGLYTICPNPACKSVTHLTCLSKHFLADQDAILPVQGNCPACHVELRWVNVVKELSLRIRGQKEVENLIKVKRARKKKDALSTQVIADSVSEDDDEDDEVLAMEEEMDQLREFDEAALKNLDGNLDFSEVSSGSDAELDPKPVERIAKSTKGSTAWAKNKKIVIEDSDWDDAIEL